MSKLNQKSAINIYKNDTLINTMTTEEWCEHSFDFYEAKAKNTHWYIEESVANWNQEQQCGNQPYCAVIITKK